MPLPINPQMPPQSPPPGMFAQMAQQPQGAPPNPSAMPQGAAPQQMNPAIILQMIETLPPQIQKLLAQRIIQNAASQGRGGDTMIAHLTPGEKTVPPEVQTPKVLATLNKAYKEKGVSPEQFTAGTPQSSRNPSTGLPEYNFMSAFLPAALGIAGSIAAPYLAPELMSAATASAIGSGVGTTVGGLATGKSPTQAALSGLGAGAGGYVFGNLGNGLTAGGNLPAGSAMSGAPTGNIVGPNLPNPGMMTSGQVASQNPGFMNAVTNAASHPNYASMAGSTIGGAVGNSIGAPPKPKGPVYPPGFNTPMDPVGSKGSAQDQLGMTNSIQPRPNFTGYNPATNYPAAYNFFPQA